jgi:hypothetical protein
MDVEKRALPLPWFLSTCEFNDQVEFGNYRETAQRHPSIGGTPLDWNQLRDDVHSQVTARNFTGVARRHPFHHSFSPTASSMRWPSSMPLLVGSIFSRCEIWAAQFTALSI